METGPSLTQMTHKDVREDEIKYPPPSAPRISWTLDDVEKDESKYTVEAHHDNILPVVRSDEVSEYTFDGDEYDGEDDGSFVTYTRRSPGPTEEEIVTLRRVADKIPMSAFLIAFVELCERLAWYGLSGPFQNYLQRDLPPGGDSAGAPPDADADIGAGALGLGQSAATGLNNMFYFLAFISPIPGAIVADAKLGRYNTIALSALVYFIGLLIITLTSTPHAIATGAALPGWIVGALIVATGTGGIKSNVSPLVADQYRTIRMYTKVLPSGEKVIVDPNVTITRIYNIFYWCINLGALGSVATTFAELHVGYWLAFLIPTAVFLLVPAVLLLGYKSYERIPPRGSVLIESWRVYRLALQGFWSRPWTYVREAKVSGVWERAKPSYIRKHGFPVAAAAAEGRRSVGVGVGVEVGGGSQVGDGSVPKWFTWDDEFVDELKRTLQASKVFLFYPLYWVSYGQVTSNLVSQADSMSMTSIPNDLLINANPIALIILIPLVDLVFYRGLRRMGIILGPIFRIFIGFMLATVSMIYTAIVQHFIYSTSACGEFATSCPTRAPLSVWVQIPSYVFIASSEIFTSITGLEYAYNKAPLRMKSVVMAIYLLMVALGNALNAALSAVAVDPHLVWLYGAIAVLTFASGLTFFLCFRHLDRTEEASNVIGKAKERER